MSDQLAILIVDDEPLAHQVLEKYAEGISFIKVIGNAYDGVSALNFVNENKVDAILLDIQLPDLSGMELLETLQHRAPKVIFTTAYTEYAIQSFDFDQVIDYLNKPIAFPRFIKAIDRLKYQLDLEASAASDVPSTVENHSGKLDHLMIKEDKVIHKIDLDTILYIQSWGNYLKVFLSSNQTRLVRRTIGEMESDLDSQGFVRVHKSYLINTKHVSAIDGNQVLIVDQKLPIGRNYRLHAMKVIGVK